MLPICPSRLQHLEATLTLDTLQHKNLAHQDAKNSHANKNLIPYQQKFLVTKNHTSKKINVPPKFYHDQQQQNSHVQNNRQKFSYMSKMTIKKIPTCPKSQQKIPTLPKS